MSKSKQEQENHVPGGGPSGAARVIATFISMAMAEWRTLVGEVRDALASHRRHRDAAEQELFRGRYKLMSKNDDDLPVL